MRVAHIITSLQTGGAENVLYRHLRSYRARMDRPLRNEGRGQMAVFSLKDKGPVAEKIEKLGISVRAMNFRENPFSGLRELRKTLASFGPDLVQTWLYHADFLGGLVARTQSRPVIWSIHHGNPKSENLKWATQLFTHLNAFCGNWIPDYIVSCSRTAAEAHVEFGYPEKKMSIIPNGFELNQYRPDEQGRREFRDEVGIPYDVPVVGKVARYHPVKDHENFLQAAVRAQRRRSDLHFVLAGSGVTREETLFRKYERRLESGTLHLLGRRDDIPRLMAALDLATLASKTEAFPMVLGEAMACGVPCVATDVGDASYLLGDTGIVVPVRDPEAMAGGWLQLVMSPEHRKELGRRARERVQEKFSQEAVTNQYVSLYERLVNPKG